MNTQRSDDFIRTRIKIGKEGAMPAFGTIVQRCRYRCDHPLHPLAEAGAGMSAPARCRGLRGLAWLVGGLPHCGRHRPARCRRSRSVARSASARIRTRCRSPAGPRQPPGFQIELGQALAQQLGVSLTLEWVLISYQIPRTDCDIILDTIAASDAPPDFGIKLSKPYYRSGVDSRRAARAARSARSSDLNSPYQGRGADRFARGDEHRSAARADLGVRLRG